MKVTGNNITSAAGFQFHFCRRQEEPLNSVQNGLLLSSDIHQLFDNYAFSIKPDVCIPNRTFSVKLRG